LEMIGRVTSALALFLWIAAPCLLSACGSGADGYPVTRVVDGDTLIVDVDGSEERVRLIGVDTPESVHPDEKRNVPYGAAASEFTKTLTEGKTVTLELDVQERDRYGRLLAYVYLDEVMLNKTLLSEGYAKLATYPPNVRYVDEFTQLQAEARENGAGIWAEEQPRTQARLQTQAEAAYIGNSHTMKFHRPDCRYVPSITERRRVRLSSRTQAEADGYEACKVCKP
jgi:micrococcal nuclease